MARTQDSHAVRANPTWALAALCWLIVIAVLEWLNLAEFPGWAGRVLDIASTVAMAPFVLGSDFPWWPTWQAEWAGKFVVGFLSLGLLSSYAIRPTRLTAALSTAGALWWLVATYLVLS